MKLFGVGLEIQKSDTQKVMDRVKFYLDNKGMKCPFCKSRTLDTIGDLEVSHSDAVVFQSIQCKNCLKTWTDIYELVEFEEWEDEN